MKRRGTPTLILCGDLVKAVKRESSQAVMHHFGVASATVWRWRQALGVPRSNEGSHRLWREISISRTDDRLALARRNSKTPKALAKASASLKGRIQHPNTMAAVRKAARRPRSAAWKEKMAAFWRKKGHPPGHPELRFWTPQEEALLGTAMDVEIARQIGRRSGSVHWRRTKLGIPKFNRRSY